MYVQEVLGDYKNVSSCIHALFNSSEGAYLFVKFESLFVFNTCMRFVNKYVYKVLT